MSQQHQEPFWIKTEDWHTAGEPFRIIPTLPPHITTTGPTVRHRRLNILSTPNHPLDLLRKSLCHEPRGHADMYGGFIVPADDDTAHFGVLFWHKDGFSTACGHGSIALGRWAVARGIVEAVEEGSVDVVIDFPSGRVVAKVVFMNAEVTHVDFVNVESYQFAKDVFVGVEVKGREVELKVDLSWGGAVVASVDAKALGLSVEVGNHMGFIDVARQIKAFLGDAADHADTGLASICFFEAIDDNDVAITQRNVLVFADGQIDRSPCGSGTGARVAVLLAQGKLKDGKKLIHHSIINTTFEAGIVEMLGDVGGYPACVPLVRGDASLTGRHEFYIDPRDPTYPGFLLR